MDKNLREKYELQALFDLSKALNSSLNLKTILDTILLTPMGKLLIARGLVFIARGERAFMIETLKGLPKSILGKVIEIDEFPQGPCSVKELPPTPWQAFLFREGVELVIPILHDGKELGMIGFGNKILDSGFTDSELDYLHSLSNIAATAVQNGIIFQELHEANRKLEKKVQELNTLSEIVKELNATLSTLESEKVVNLLAYSIMGEMMVNRCLIFLADEDSMTLFLNKGLSSKQVDGLLNDDVIMKELRDLEQPVQVCEHPEPAISTRFGEVALSVLIPMRIENKSKGVIVLGDKITKQPFVKDDLDFLSILGSWSMISIETARLIEQEIEKQKLEEELRIASRMQRQLLPASCPKIETVQVAAVNHPSRQVGGDYYDCIKLSDNEYLFCIADVSGKGTPAALLMSNLQASLRAMVRSGLVLSEIVQRINGIIYDNTAPDKFITAFFGILKVMERRFTSVNAGHNPPYLFHKDASFQTLEQGGLILGMMHTVEYEFETVQLHSGDSLIMFTDGVSEAMNAEGEEFHEHRIEKCVTESLHASADEILRHIINSVADFSAGEPQADDITVLTIKMI
ncbi:MAG: GAF domain-containing SpoIIE family protein phosphatase [bacterium]